MRANGRIFGVRLSLLLWLPAQRIPEEEWLIWSGRTDLCTSERAGQCPPSAFGIVEYPIRGESTVDMRANGRIFGVRLSLLLWLPAQRIPEGESLIFRRKTGDARMKSRAFLRSTCPRTRQSKNFP